MDSIAEENRKLRRMISDLAAITALPAIWSTYDARQLAESLIEVIFKTAKPDFVVLQLHDVTGAKSLQVAGRSGTLSHETSDRIIAALSPVLEERKARVFEVTVDSVGGEGACVALVPIGIGAEAGLLLAGARRATFPTNDERELLDAVANQAAAALRYHRETEARRRTKDDAELALRGSNIGTWNVAMPDGVLRNARIDLTNIWEQLGYPRPTSPADFTTARLLVHSDDAARFESAIHDHLVRSTKELKLEHRVRCKDGSTRWMLTRGVAVRNADGTPIQLIGSSLDITERRRADEAMRVASERLDLAILGSNIGIWDLDLAPDDQYTQQPVRFINVWERLGYDPAEFPKDAVASRALGHPDDLVRVDAAIAACLAGETPGIQVENRIRHKDGSWHWLLTLGRCTRDATGTAVRLIGTVLDITERKRVEEKIQRSEALFSAAENLAHLGSWSWHIGSGQLEWSDELYRVFGLDPSSQLPTHDSFIAAIHPDDRVRITALIDAACRGEATYDCEFRITSPDGQARVVHSRGDVIRDASGMPVEMIGMAQDITERNQSEEAVRASEAKFRALEENVPSLVWSCTLDRQCDYVNPQFMRYTGQTEAQLLGDWRLDNIHPDDHATMLAAWEGRMSAGEPAEFEARLRRHDGAWRWFQIRAAPVRDEQGQLIKWFGINTDIDDLKRVSEALRLGEQRLTAELDAMKRLQQVSTRLVQMKDGVPLLEEILDAAIAITAADMGNLQIVDDDGALRIVASRGFEAAFLEHFNAVPSSEAACVAVMQTGERVVIDDVTTSPILAGTRAGEVLQAAGVRALQSTPLIARSGQLLGILSTYYREPRSPAERDLGVLNLLARQAADWIERTRVEAAITRAKQSAEQANRLKDEFLAIVSHELRTPLAAMLLWSQILESRSLSAEDEARALRSIQESAVSQQRLIEDLLDFSRILAGEIGLDTHELELIPVVRAAIDIVRPFAVAKNISIEETLDPRAGRVKADPGRMQQVLLNLLNNAIKFTPDGGQVTVRLQRAGGMLQISIADTGQGIVAAFLPHVFERFRQADASRVRRHGGLGLGLAIARELVELQEGTIRAESSGEGRGATFAIDLPIIVSEPGARAAPHHQPADETTKRFVPSPTLRGIRVLVVEDEDTTREVIVYLLQQCEAEVTAVTNARDGLLQFESSLHARRLDVLISDIGLPEVDGYELIRQVRAVEQRSGALGPTPAVALTAYTRDHDRTAALDAGFTTYLAKPITAAALVQTVTGCVNRARRR